MAQAIGSPANRSSAGTPWILGPAKDLALVIGPPLLILPGVALARHGMSIESFAYYVAAFGALGHHLPGMLRAYGDRDLFARFRARFIAAPVLLIAVCVFFNTLDLNGIKVIATVWGVWHGLAQAYGFGRIYDSKTGTPSPLTARIDFALCIAWFGAGVMFSPGRLGNLLQEFYESGGLLIDPASIHSLQAAWGLATAIVTLAFAANYLADYRRGRAQSSAKLLLFASSFGFWWYAMVGLDNVLLGVALFEIFHDFQYLAIVWSFNRKVVDRGGRVGGFTRFLFRNSGAMVGLYVGLVFAYGATAIAADHITHAAISNTLLGAIVASGFLHFYYDGFIWKVREKSISRDLGVNAGAAPGGPRPEGQPGWLRHAAAWSLFAVPAVYLAGIQLSNPEVDRLAAYTALAETVPDDDRSQILLGGVLLQKSQPREARAHFARAVQIAPDSTLAWTKLGDCHRLLEEWPAAIRAYEASIALAPDDAEVQSNLGLAVLQEEQFERARDIFDRALSIDPSLTSALTNRSFALVQLGDLPGARASLQAALRSDPKTIEAHYNLGLLYEHEGDDRRAAGHFREAMNLGYDAQVDLDRVLARSPGS